MDIKWNSPNTTQINLARREKISMVEPYHSKRMLVDNKSRVIQTVIFGIMSGRNFDFSRTTLNEKRSGAKHQKLTK